MDLDCNDDPDALYAHSGIALKGVIDVKILDVATRGPGWYIKGMGSFIQRNCILSDEMKCTSQRIEAHSRALFAPRCRGSSGDFSD